MAQLNATDILPEIVDAYNKGRADGYNRALDDIIDLYNTGLCRKTEDGYYKAYTLKELADMLKGKYDIRR